MKFLKLTEIKLTRRNVIIKGHCLVNLASVRKIVKVRDPFGGHCCKISYFGLDNSNDTYVEETPDKIAALCEGPALPKIGEFKAIKIKPKPISGTVGNASSNPETASSTASPPQDKAFYETPEFTSHFEEELDDE